MSAPITFLVPGVEGAEAPAATRGGAAPALPGAFGRGRVKQSVQVSAQRAGGAPVRVTAVPGKDLVLLQLSNGPALLLHPENARDLMLAQAEPAATRGAPADAAQRPDEVAVPVQLGWRQLDETAAARGTTRGVGDVILSLLQVISDPAAELVAAKVVERVDAQVNEGVYALGADSLVELKGDRPVAQIPATADGKPILVLVHGTFSTTKGTFEKLWTDHPQRVRQLFRHYEGRVYALDHRTLGVSPLANALTLAKALPKGTPVHLVTHSRGGLVAEALARACAVADLDQELDHFKGEEYAQHRADLKALAAAAKDLRLERVVRVACPARGTLLASKRLDAYMSVFKWTLELAGAQVLPAIVDFVAAVAQERTEPRKIPGLAAQMPDNPFVQWLHAAEEMIPGELRVVAGDIAGDSVISWLKVLLSDSFYRTDNDLVVQTSSMYGGAPRLGGARYVFDQGGKVSHFAYFGNERTAEAIVDALTLADPAGYRTIGPLSWKGEDATGLRAGPREGKPSEKPAVFVLPGILGSNLRIGNKRIWLAFRLFNGLKRLEYSEAGDAVEPDGPIGMVYDRLGEFLSETHEVIEFAFDWRLPIEEEGKRLGRAVRLALDARKTTGQPVRLLAHSMGGLVARAMQLECKDVWDEMMAREGARVLMLGTPNAGSWAPMQVLSGDDSFGNMLVDIGAPFQDAAARKLMAQMPGFIQLQAELAGDKYGLSRSEAWQKLADDDLKEVREHNFWHHDLMLHECIWGVPAQPVLDRAVALRKRLDAQKPDQLVAAKILLVVGKSDFTPDGYEMLARQGLVYLNAQEAGDGRVTLDRALLPGVRTWKLDCEHGSLPSEKTAFAAYLDLLQKGTTELLVPVDGAAATRGGAAAPAPAPRALLRSRRSRAARSARPPQSPNEVFAAFDIDARAPGGAPAGVALHVTVTNGDLAFVQPPILIGHYRGQLYGSERVMDRLIGGKMQESLALGRYPAEPGSHQVFVNTQSPPDSPGGIPRPEAVVVVGLGEENNLRASDLAETVRQAALAWAQRIAERPERMPPQFELAATLIGSGGSGISPGQSAQLVAQGVHEANARLATMGGRWPTVSRLHLIELYLDRASEALRALQVQAAASPAFFRVDDTVRPGNGALERPLDFGYRGSSYDFISALTHKEEGHEAAIRYTLDTRRARTEMRTQQAQGELLRQLVKSFAREAATNRNIGKTLFQLLIPVELEPFLGGTAEMVMELDPGTAGIPWELLDTRARGGGDSRPWAIRSKLVRKLRLEDFRPQPVDAGREGGVLVIGEPKCPPNYPRLPGARREASAVVKRLTASPLPANRIKALISPEDPRLAGASGTEVIEALLAQEWRIVHISGHGEKPDEKTGRPSRGVVLSDDIFLGQAEIRSMRKVPELVFVNCCYLAAADPEGLMSYSRPAFAATVAEELIRSGVRCVVAAGWAVDDDAAEMFAHAFYDALLRGSRFMEAVALAREAAMARGDNTWAAYQCYGDPNWTLELHAPDERRATHPGQKYAAVTSAQALMLALDTVATQASGALRSKDGEEEKQELRFLDSTYGALWGGAGEVAESFGRAWAALGELSHAIPWFGKAVAAPDGSASMKAAEQLANLRARVAAENVEAALKSGDKRRAEKAAREGEAEVSAALQALERLAELQPSMERSSLLGSAYKRLALLQGAGGVPPREAIASAKRHYAEAEKLGLEAGLRDVFYPALNRLAAEVALDGSLDPKEVKTVRRTLAAKLADEPDFWSAAAGIELRMYEALARSALEEARGAIEHEFEDLHRRVGTNKSWRSVRDQAYFVLRPYAKRTRKAGERHAVEALLKRLESYA